MTIPTVIETTPRRASVEHDPFVDDLRRPLGEVVGARRREPDRAS